MFPWPDESAVAGNESTSELARTLREQGVSIKRIAAAVGVSQSSVSLWTRDIELTPDQRSRNLRGLGGPLNREDVRRRAASWAARCRRRRQEWQEEGRARAREGDPLHMAGCMLYWAEGAKARNSLKFVNSDAQMVKLFARFLTDALGVDPASICMRLNVYTTNGLSIDAVERYWLDLLHLEPASLRKHPLDHRPTSSSGRAVNKLPYGVCTLAVHQTWAAQHVYGAIQEYAGFEQPKWLG